MPSGRTSKFPLSGWQELPLPRAERGLTAAGRADALYVVNDALGSFLLRASLAQRALPRHGFLSIHARLHVGIRGKSGLVLLDESPSQFDPLRTLRRTVRAGCQPFSRSAPG